MENKIYDIIIVGAGPAGMTSAIYAGRAGKTVALIDKLGFGGNILNSPKVENIPGFTSISGADFSANMYEQVCNLQTVEHIINEVALITYSYGLFKVSFIDGTTIVGLSVIIASGTKHRELKLPTKDVYYCVTCDGPLFKNKNVFVVGSGNTGATFALELAGYCKNVHICDISKNMLCEKTLQDRINATKNIFWHPETSIKDVSNKTNSLTSVELTDKTIIKCSAIFAAIGMIPQTDFAVRIANTDSNNYLLTNEDVCAEISGLFVAGDCRAKKIRQVTTACADGTIAAIKAIEFINLLNTK